MTQLRQSVVRVGSVDPLQLWDANGCWDDMMGLYDAAMDKVVGRCLEKAFDGTDKGSLVRACPDDSRDGFKAFKYYSWFQQQSGCVPCLHALPEVGNIRVVAQFRCSSHHLDCEAGRHRGVRSDRSCRFCSSGEVEDELHILFCDAWKDARVSFSPVFESVSYLGLLEAVESGGDIDSCMWTFMNTMSLPVLNMFVGYLKRVFKCRRGLDSEGSSVFCCA